MARDINRLLLSMLRMVSTAGQVLFNLFAENDSHHFPLLVLAWLQSPTANGLFSPGGGLGSALNTPRGIPRTPRTPTHTSFFFSDVASLPRNGEFASPKNKRPGMISISPLAPKRKFVPRSMPLLGESPKMDAVHMAERDLMEDEDLSLLLQLASHSCSNTPRSSQGGR